MSSWLDRFTYALNALKDAHGAAWDIATSIFDDDEDSFTDLTDRLGRVFTGSTSAIGQTLGGVFGGLDALYENVVAEPASAAVTTASLLDSPTWQQRVGASNSWEALGSIGETWAVAREMANTRSFGQSVWAMFTTNDIIAEEKKIEEAKESILFNAVTGTLDAIVSWKYDPTNILGKTYSTVKTARQGINVGYREGDSLFEKAVARAGSKVGLTPGRENFDELADSEAVTEFLRWKEGKSGREIANHPAVQRSAYPSVLAGLLQEADEGTSRLIIALAYGSDAAKAKLAQRRDDLAQRLARADNLYNPSLEWELVKSGEYKTYMPKLPPPGGKPKPVEPEQLPLFDIGAFPIGQEGKGGKSGKPKDGTWERPEDLPPAGLMGPPGTAYEYPNVSGNLPKTKAGRYLVNPKTGGKLTGRGGISVDAGPYSQLGPINPQTAKELMPWLRGDAAKRQREEALTIPGLPPESQWKEASSWEMHDQTLEALRKGFGETSSARIKPFQMETHRWFAQMQDEIRRKSEKELELLTAAVGRGGDDPGRGVWASMQDYAIRSNKDLKKADRTLAYDWESKSHAEEALILPKPFGTPIRVIKDFMAPVARSFTEKRPPSYIDPNRGDSHAPFAAFLHSIKAFPPAQKSDYLRQYMAAFTPEAKREVIEAVEKHAIRATAEKYGLSKEAQDAIADKAIDERNKMIDRLKGSDKKNVYGMRLVDGEAIPVETILFESQVVNGMPLLDIKKYDRAFAANQGLLNAADEIKQSKIDFLDRTFDTLQQVWSFSVLMRLGYTIRTLTDDALRLMASMGAMSVMAGINAGFQAAFTKSDLYRPGVTGWLKHAAAGDLTLTKGGAGQRAKWLGRKAVMQSKKAAARVASKTWGNQDVTALRDILQGITDKWGRDLGTVRRQDLLGFEYDGRTFQAALAGRGDVYAKHVGGSYEAIARTTNELIEQLRKEWAAWDVKNPQDPAHLESWAYAAVNQIGKSALARQFLEGKTAAEVERWLRRTPQGRATHKAIGKHHDPEDLAGQAQAVVDYYLPVLRGHSDPFILRTLAKEGKLDAKTLENYFPNPLERPSVHGPTIDWNLYQGGPRKWLDSIISNGFKWLSQIPTDRLIRHPAFSTMYRHNIRRSYDQLVLHRGGRETITSDDLRAIEHVAREKSLRQMNNLLYYMAEKSNIAHLARFYTGFFSAWEDSIRKWGRLAIDKPHLLYQGHKVWEAPNQMYLGSSENEFGDRVERVQVVDKQGRQVKKVNGQMMVRDVNGQWQEFDSNLNDKTMIRLSGRFPEWLKVVFPGIGDKGELDIPKSSLNLILQGDPWWAPGAGPWMQLAVSQIEERVPTGDWGLDKVYDWAIPFGRTDLDDVMLPPWLKQAVKIGQGIDDGAYAVEWLRIAQTEEMRIRQGLRDRPKSPAAFAKEIDDRAKSMFRLRSFVRFFMPFTADLNSPYQMYIDQYRQLREVYGDEADERFYERYGDDLYIFTTALSKNNIGVTATKTAFKAVEEYKDMIADNPEYGALIIGPEALRGEFDPRVYQAQFEQMLGPGSSLTVRERRTPMEALEENRVRLGWIKYRKRIDLLMAKAHDLGMTVETHGEILSRARGLIAQGLAEENEDWGRDFYDTDLRKIPNRIKFFTALVQEERLLNNQLRTDLRVLNEYLKKRAEFVSVLKSLKAQDRPHTLDADDNAELSRAWEAYKERMAASDTRFSDLYNRYLVNDRLQF